MMSEPRKTEAKTVAEIKEMLQEIIEKRAPYKHDKIEMALAGFEKHSKYATNILVFIEALEGENKEFPPAPEPVRRMCVKTTGEITYDFEAEIERDKDKMSKRFIMQRDERWVSEADFKKLQDENKQHVKALQKTIQLLKEQGDKAETFYEGRLEAIRKYADILNASHILHSHLIAEELGVLLNVTLLSEKAQPKKTICICRNPHERIYRGCSESCKFFPICEAKGLDKKTAKDCEYAGKNEWGPTTDCNNPKGDGFCSLHHCPKDQKTEDNKK